VVEQQLIPEEPIDESLIGLDQDYLNALPADLRADVIE